MASRIGLSNSDFFCRRDCVRAGWGRVFRAQEHDAHVHEEEGLFVPLLGFLCVGLLSLFPMSGGFLPSAFLLSCVCRYTDFLFVHVHLCTLVRGRSRERNLIHRPFITLIIRHDASCESSQMHGACYSAFTPSPSLPPRSEVHVTAPTSPTYCPLLTAHTPRITTCISPLTPNPYLTSPSPSNPTRPHATSTTSQPYHTRAS